MQILTNYSNNNFYSNKLNKSNVKQAPLNNTKSENIKKIGITSGLVALAATGYYIAKGKSQNINQIFRNVQNSSSIMQELKSSKLSPKNFKNLMFKITTDEKTSEKFINEMITNPKKSKENVQILQKKIGNDTELLDWMHSSGGYQESYQKFTDKLFKSKDTKTDDIIKLSPNWNIWKIKEKFGEDFVIGEVPKEFGDINNYRQMFNTSLKNSEISKNKNGIILGDYITGGLSGKAIRKIETENKKYILKFQSNSDLNTNLKDDLSMKSDSAFLNAQLDRYLELNNYKQGPKLKFYDNKTNSAIYEMTEGQNPEKINNILDVNKQLNDLNSLGVYYNDVSTSNFIKENNNLTFIDSGEASFTDFFKPGVSGYNFSLPNLNGHSIADSAAAIMLSKNK